MVSCRIVVSRGTTLLTPSTTLLCHDNPLLSGWRVQVSAFQHHVNIGEPHVSEGLKTVSVIKWLITQHLLGVVRVVFIRIWRQRWCLKCWRVTLTFNQASGNSVDDSGRLRKVRNTRSPRLVIFRGSTNVTSSYSTVIHCISKSSLRHPIFFNHCCFRQSTTFDAAMSFTVRRSVFFTSA